MAEFTKDRYGVDVLKVEVPINMKFVEGIEGLRRTDGLHEAGGDGALPRRRRTVSTKPFIYLSAGVSNAEFTETLELAAEAGTRFSGVLCGRATWKDGIPVYGKQGADAFRQWLRDRRRQEHRQRQRSPEDRAPLVRVLRREVGRRAEITVGAVREPPNGTSM